MGLLGLFYKKGFFERSSIYLWKETALVIGLIGENYISSYFISEYFWRNCKETIRKNAYMKEWEFYELKN